jgi:hypothetical protein
MFFGKFLGSEIPVGQPWLAIIKMRTIRDENIVKFLYYKEL